MVFYLNPGALPQAEIEAAPSALNWPIKRLRGSGTYLTLSFSFGAVSGDQGLIV